MKTADIFGGIIGILIGLFALWEGAKMPTDVVMKIGPSFFPNILAGCLILFSIVLLINATRGSAAQNAMTQAVLRAEATVILRSRAWSIGMGFEPDPAQIPPLHQLLRKE